MKKRVFSIIMAMLLILTLCPIMAFATEETPAPAGYTGYSAIGDSICAGFSQQEYINRIDEIGFTMDNNVEKSPTTCYARLVGAAFGIDDLNDTDDGPDDLDDTTYNLGKCGCDSNELLKILTDSNYVEDGTNYYELYQNYLSKSDLITLHIGSNDLIMSVADAILACVDEELTHKEAMALLEPLLTGQDICSAIETVCKTELSQEDMEKIQEVLSPESLTEILNEAMQKFVANFPQILQIICTTYPGAQLVVLNCYNPYPGDNDLSKMIQGYIVAMNDVMADCCNGAGLLLVKVSDTPTLGLDPHPTAAGHQQIADRIVDALANTITATAEAGGTITPAGQTLVKNGEALTYTIKANSGFQIRDVLVDGVSIGAVSSYTFEDVSADHTITANFRCLLHFDTYTALGDSITSGYALGGEDGYTGDFSNPKDCYVHVAAEKMTVSNNYNDAMIALTSGDMLDILKNPENPYHDLIVQHLGASDLITIDIGSNDLSMTLFDILLECLGMKEIGDDYTVAERTQALEDMTKEETLQSLLTKNPEKAAEILNAFQSQDIVGKRLESAIKMFTENWDQIIEAIRVINPSAKLAVIGYYNPYPNFNFKLDNKDYGIGAMLDPYIVTLNTYISQQSKKIGEYVYVSTYGKDQNGQHIVELNSTVAYNNMRNGLPDASFNPMQIQILVDPHPTAKGHATIASRLLDALGNLKPGDPGYPYTPVYVPCYSVNVTASTGGTVSPGGFNIIPSGGQRTFTFTPNAGYVVESIMVDGKPVEIASSYTIKFSDTGAHTLNVTFIKDTGVAGDKDENPFDDIADTDWFFDDVMHMYIKSIMSGITDTTFEPYMSASRAMIATILYRIENQPEVTYSAIFDDVPEGEWYADAVLWAAEAGIVEGFGNGVFAPMDNITREQMATILYRYAKYKGYDTVDLAELTDFEDASNVQEWAVAAMQWAVAKGLMEGKDKNHLKPGELAIRAEVAAIFTRFLELYLAD